jgi:protein phosphatase
MGGHSAGEIASRIGVETILKEYYASECSPLEALVAAIHKASERIYEASGEELDREGMGCTVVACVILGGDAMVAHVGDSRAYLLRNGELKLLTKDHLHITDDLGMSDEEAREHRLRHMLSRALGQSGEVLVDTATMGWEPGDRFLLCTDGLSGSLSESELAEGLSEAGPREAVTLLLQRAESNQSDDNSSAIVILLASPVVPERDGTLKETQAGRDDGTPTEPPPVGTDPVLAFVQTPESEFPEGREQDTPETAPPVPLDWAVEEPPRSGRLRRWLRNLGRFGS